MESSSQPRMSRALLVFVHICAAGSALFLIGMEFWLSKVSRAPTFSGSSISFSSYSVVDYPTYYLVIDHWLFILIIFKVSTNLFWIANLVLLVFFASVGVYSYCCGSHRYYETKV